LLANVEIMRVKNRLDLIEKGAQLAPTYQALYLDEEESADSAMSRGRMVLLEHLVSAVAKFNSSMEVVCVPNGGLDKAIVDAKASDKNWKPTPDAFVPTLMNATFARKGKGGDDFELLVCTWSDTAIRTDRTDAITKTGETEILTGTISSGEIKPLTGMEATAVALRYIREHFGSDFQMVDAGVAYTATRRSDGGSEYVVESISVSHLLGRISGETSKEDALINFSGTRLPIEITGEEDRPVFRITASPFEKWREMQGEEFEAGPNGVTNNVLDNDGLFLISASMAISGINRAFPSALEICFTDLIVAKAGRMSSVDDPSEHIHDLPTEKMMRFMEQTFSQVMEIKAQR
jgi:hypothetical protein